MAFSPVSGRRIDKAYLKTSGPIRCDEACRAHGTAAPAIAALADAEPVEPTEPEKLIVPYWGTGPKEPETPPPATVSVIGAEPLAVPEPGTFAV